MSFKITSDSTCDLNHLTQQRDITILPLQVNLDAAAYHDGVDITPQDIFDFVAKTGILPKIKIGRSARKVRFFAYIRKRSAQPQRPRATPQACSGIILWGGGASLCRLQYPRCDGHRS